MKEVFEHIPQTRSNSFVYRYFRLPRFNGAYHYHPEVELTYIESSRGKRLIGSNISDYTEGDLVLIGPNIPHCWKSSATLLQGDHDARAKVIQFHPEFFGTRTRGIPELSFLKTLSEKASSGLLIKGKTREEIIKKLNFEFGENSFQDFITIVEILFLIAESTDTELIDHQFSELDFSRREAERFNRVFSYIAENYTADIKLNDLAELAHLTSTSFCRYFRQVTHKTPSTVIMELRIRHACNLLKTSEYTITDICFESGFGNLSHFNKAFKQSTGVTPSRYRQMFCVADEA